MTGLSLLGETVLEWNKDERGHYHAKRMAIDSMLCNFRRTYPTERIDSVRYLLEDKERQMLSIVRILDKQQAVNKKIADQVPVIAQKSVQEQPKAETKRIFGHIWQKEEVKPTATATMLHSLNKNIISEQKAQSRRLSERADSLAEHNAELNRQLQELIRQIDEKVQIDLKIGKIKYP